MSWIVDTCILLDIFEADPEFATASADVLDRLGSDGLELAPVSYVELAPAFHGDHFAQDEFLALLGISCNPDGSRDDLLSAHKAWHSQVIRKRQGTAPKRPIADVLIGALALRHDGLITRNPADFKALFPSLRIETP